MMVKRLRVIVRAMVIIGLDSWCDGPPWPQG